MILFYLEKFIKESNKIESIQSYNEPEQVKAMLYFLSRSTIGIPELMELAQTFQTTSYLPLVSLRDKPGLNVYIGDHIPPKGGPAVKSKLVKLLSELNSGISPYKWHHKYESLHPLTDCNGRTGRALWAWMMKKKGYDFKRGFLHQWYYQSLSEGRK